MAKTYGLFSVQVVQLHRLLCFRFALALLPLACLDLKVIGILAHSPPVTTWLDHNVQPKRPRIISTRPKAETGDMRPRIALLPCEALRI